MDWGWARVGIVIRQHGRHICARSHWQAGEWRSGARLGGRDGRGATPRIRTCRDGDPGKKPSPGPLDLQRVSLTHLLACSTLIECTSTRGLDNIAAERIGLFWICLNKQESMWIASDNMRVSPRWWRADSLSADARHSATSFVQSQHVTEPRDTVWTHAAEPPRPARFSLNEVGSPMRSAGVRNWPVPIEDGLLPQGVDDALRPRSQSRCIPMGPLNVFLGWQQVAR